MTTDRKVAKLIDALVDSAFGLLQHDTGPQDEEYQFLRAAMTAEFRRIFAAMLAAPQLPPIDGLSKRDFVRRSGDVDESISVLAAGAQEETAVTVDVRLDSAEHDLNTAVLARPHGDESTPSAAAKSAVRS